MIRYYKLFDLLNRRGMKKSDLREILAPKTIAKLSKGANLNTDVIDKICLFLKCQPSDIMEVVEYVDEPMQGVLITNKHEIARDVENETDVIITREIIDDYPDSLEEADENLLTHRIISEPWLTEEL